MLLASPSYQELSPRLVSNWVSCPFEVLQLLTNSSLPDPVASKILAHPGDCLATHIAVEQQCRQSPGMGTEASAQKCFKMYYFYIREWNLLVKGEGRCANMVSSERWTFQFPALVQASHGTFWLFAVHNLLASTWLTNAVSMCVSTQKGRPAISGFESYKVRVSAALQHIYCIGRDCRIQAALVAKAAPLLVCAPLHW